MNPLELSEQEIVRRGSMEQMRALGIEPYPAAEYVVTGYTDEICENFKDDAPEKRQVTIAALRAALIFWCWMSRSTGWTPRASLRSGS